MEITVRAATVADAQAVAAVNLASWEAAYRGLIADEILDGMTVTERTARWAVVLATGATQVLVAETGNGVVGYCRMEAPSQEADSDVHTAKIRGFYVTPASFRRGVGSALMGAALGTLADRGFREVTLWVVTENTAAHAFYARQGFIPDGTANLWLGQVEQIRLRRPLI